MKKTIAPINPVAPPIDELTFLAPSVSTHTGPRLSRRHDILLVPRFGTAFDIPHIPRDFSLSG